MTEPTNEYRDESGDESGLTESEYYRLLSVERRRVVLDVLAEERTPVELERLAESVAARERRGEASGGGGVDEVALTLHHNHLPMLAELGVVDYDPGSKRVDVDEERVDRLTELIGTPFS